MVGHLRVYGYRFLAYSFLPGSILINKLDKVFLTCFISALES